MEEKMKYDKQKVALGLLPLETLETVAQVFEFGAQKYGIWDWFDDGKNTEFIRSFSSIQRHLFAWHNGEDIDPDSGLPHLAHATSQLMILMSHSKNHPEMDNRRKNNENRRHSKRTKKKIHRKDIYYSQQ